MIGWEPDDMQVYGIMRSGHHGVIHWIVPHYTNKGQVTHYNNCCMRRNRVDPDEIRRFGPGPKRLTTIFSFEDDRGFFFTPEQVNRRCRPGRAIMVLRDPYNQFASRLAMKQKRNLHDWHNCLNTESWKNWAEEYLGRSKYFPFLIRISYNQWFADLSYRKILSENFGPHTDMGLNYIGKDGGGSSFDGCDFQNRAQEMTVFDRWQQFRDHPEFKEILNNKSLRNLCKEIFPTQYEQMPPL